MQNDNSVLIVGGYGVVGQQIARIIRQRHPDLAIALGGRNPAKAESLASELGNARSIRIDVEQASPLQGFTPRAIINAVNDPRDQLLMDAVRRGIPLVDITRWTDRFRAALKQLEAHPPRAPIVFASGWMGGVAAIVATAASRTLTRVDRIDISILYSLKDKSGPNSVEYMDRLAVPFEVTLDGKTQVVQPMSDPHSVVFPGNFRAHAYRFDTPDQFTLPLTLGAHTVATRIAFDDAFSTRLLVFLTRSGIWKLISGERFTSLRRGLLYNPGTGGAHKIVIKASGADAHGTLKTVVATIDDPQGQTHLTALGAVIQFERVLGLDGAPPLPAQVNFPESAPQIELALTLLREHGVTVTL